MITPTVPRTETSDGTLSSAPGTVMVLGAGGRFGRHAAIAFDDAGWDVRSFARRGLDPDVPGTHATVDALDPDALAAAAQGCDVIVYAANPPYGRWAGELPALTRSVIGAARASGATLMLPGNVYGHGESMPDRLSEHTPMAPSNELGRLRVALEEACRDATRDGVRTIVVRAGSFIEGRRTGNWFEDHIVKGIADGRVVYPGPLDRTHTWAWLPDLGRAFAALAARRAELEPFHRIGFPGWALTGRELVAALESEVGRTLKVGSMPWSLLRVAGWVSRDMRGVVAMRYLWERPHRIDGAEFARWLPGFEATSVEAGLGEALGLLERDAKTGAKNLRAR